MIEEKLLRLERMSHAEKVAYWAGKQPWDVDGVTLRLPFKSQPFGPGLVHMDDDGNITKSPMLVNRPCFGQLTAFLRHGGNQHTLTKTGGRHPNRCARCEVKEADRRVRGFGLSSIAPAEHCAPMRTSES